MTGLRIGFVALSTAAALAAGLLPGAAGAQQVGVARRGMPPVLPDVRGQAGPERPAPEQQAPTAVWQVRARLGRVIGRSTDVYRQPDPRSRWLGALTPGQYVAVLAYGMGWLSIMMSDGGPGYLSQTNVELLDYEVRTVTSASQEAQPPLETLPSAAPQQLPQLPQVASALAGGVISSAFVYEGVPYRLGGTSRQGLDCSGLVQTCFAAVGVKLPRKASEQAGVGRSVPLDQLLPGDRLYFSVKRQYDHTGIYLGNGFFIHASRSRGRVAVDHLSSNLYGSSLTSARRL